MRSPPAQGLDRRADRRRPPAGPGADGVHAGRRLRGRGEARLSGRQVPGLARGFRSLAAALPGLLIVGIILAGILSGVFTATESAAVAVTYTILLTFFIYRTMTLPNFPAPRPRR